MKFLKMTLLVFTLVFAFSCESLLDTGLDVDSGQISEDFRFETTQVVQLAILLTNYDGEPGEKVKFSILNDNQRIAAGITDNAGRYSTKLVLPAYTESITIETSNPEYRGSVSIPVNGKITQAYLYNDLDNQLSLEKPVVFEKVAVIQKFSDNSTTFNGYEFVFDGVSDNGDGSYTWTYTITGVADDGPGVKDLSHWVIGLCGDHSVANVSPGNNWEVGNDPTTGLYGLKWDHSVGKNGETKSFSFTMDQNYEVGEVEVAFKAGRDSYNSTIDGPLCRVAVDDPYDESNGDLKVYIENVEGRSCIDLYYNGEKIEEITGSELITLYVNSTDDVRVVTYDNPEQAGNYCGWFVQYGTGSFIIEDNDYIVDLTNPLINSHNYVEVTPWIAAGDCQCGDDDENVEYDICDGYPNWDEKYASVRYKSFGNTGSNEHYLGVNDLGVGGNRVETGYTWTVPGSYDIKFEFDAASHTLTSVIDNNPSTELEYTIGHAPDNPINVMGIDVVQRTTGATVVLKNLELNGKNIGNFTGDGWKSWTVNGFDVSDGFVISGTIELAGDFPAGSSEFDKIQISLGYDDNPCEDDDSDGDEVDDDDDDYPDDPDKAFNNVTDGFLAYEDLWPEKGDYDFNDLVIDYTINQITNADNKIVEIEIDLEVIAAGAKYNNAFGIEIPDLSMANITHIRGEFFHETELPNTAESRNGNFVLIPFDHTKQFFNGSTYYINTKSYPPEPTKTLNYTIKLNTPVDISAFSSPPYNPFIIINSLSNGDEVHLVGNEGTFVSPPVDNPYTDENGMPWAIHIAGNFDYPIEKMDIRTVYNYFEEWANSDGDLYNDWYLNKPGYRQSDLTYIQKD